MKDSSVSGMIFSFWIFLRTISILGGFLGIMKDSVRDSVGLFYCSIDMLQCHRRIIIRDCCSILC